jgi:hypothetical protein
MGGSKVGFLEICDFTNKLRCERVNGMEWNGNTNCSAELHDVQSA